MTWIGDMGKTAVLLGQCAALAGLAGIADATAQDFPTKPVKIIVAYAAGDGSVSAGSTDDDLRARYKSEIAFWREAAQVAGFKPD